MDRMDYFKKAGKTIILVSHALDLVRSWCDEALWLDAGLFLSADRQERSKGIRPMGSRPVPRRCCNDFQSFKLKLWLRPTLKSRLLSASQFIAHGNIGISLAERNIL